MFNLINDSYGSFYKTVGGGEGDKCYYPTRLDPYGKGCHYNCKYCYARYLLDFRGYWNPSQPGMADINKIRRKIKKLESGDVVRLGGMTDCFAPYEKQYHNTYKTIEALNDAGVHYLIVTKSNLVATDEYIDLFDKKLCHIQVSVACNDNNVLNATDNAPNFEIRKNTIETLFDNGFDVCLRLAPFLYDYSDFDVLNNINVDKCLVEFLRVNSRIESSMGDFININDYTHKEGNYNHLPLGTKLNILSNLQFKEISVCDDVDEHYNYFKNKFNFNKDDCCNLTLT